MRSLLDRGHPNFTLYPSKENLFFWRILLQGPEGTIHAGGVWLLFIEFPPNFPLDPPRARFVTPIKHCNINCHGRICHSILGRNWGVETRVHAVLYSIYGLFCLSLMPLMRLTHTWLAFSCVSGPSMKRW